MNVIQLPQPDGFLSAWDVKGVAADVIGELPLPGIEGSPLDPGDIWSVAILASVNQTSVREVCAENSEALCDDTVFDWLHTLDRGWVGFAANLLFMQLAMTILDRSGSRIVSIDFVDNPEEFTFSVFCDWIRHVLEQELERRWEIEMNGVGVPDAYTAAAG